MAAPALTIGLRLLARALRAGEMRVLLAALVVAVAATTAVGLFTDRMNGALERGAAELLAADLAVSSARPIDSRIEALTRGLGLASARTLDFRSMVAHADRIQLAEVKAVSAGYPLRGALTTAAAAFGTAEITRRIPAPGDAWPDSRLAALLGLQVGDAVELGRAVLRIDRILIGEPDRGADLLSIAPRLLVNLDAIPHSQLVVPGSRVRHRLLLAGSERQVNAARGALVATLDAEQRLEGIRDARPRIRTALERGSRFLGLATLVAVLLAAVAIALAAGRHVERQLDGVAILGCLGASRATLWRIQLVQLAALGAAGIGAGTVVGWLAQLGLARALADFAFATLPPAHWGAYLHGPLTAMLVLAGFALSPLARLRAVPPLRVIRRELGTPRGGSLVGYAAAVGAVAVLVLWQAGDPVLAAWVLGGTSATAAALVLAALGMLRALRPLRGRVGVAWRFGLANLHRRSAASVAQLVAFGLGILLLLLLTQVRGELLGRWRASLPANAPDHFLVNISPSDVGPLSAFLETRGMRAATLYPLIRARIETIDGDPVQPTTYGTARARDLARHTLNLSWSAALPPGNRVIAGHWDPTAAGTVSVERGYAEALGIELGTRLGVRVGARSLEVTVGSLREVRWDSFRPNFFVLATPGTLEDFAATYMTSVDVPGDGVDTLRELVARFPGVTVLDIDALLGKVREIIDHAARGIKYVLGFALLAGVVVLLAAVQTTVDARRRETAIVRTLGGDRRRLLYALVAEFATLGALAGLLGAGGASAIAAVLAARVFDLTYAPGIGVWSSGVAAGAIAVALTGVLATRGVLDQPPADTLRGL